MFVFLLVPMAILHLVMKVLSKDAAYFTGEGLLSINKALCKGNKSLFISSDFAVNHFLIIPIEIQNKV